MYKTRGGGTKDETKQRFMVYGKHITNVGVLGIMHGNVHQKGKAKGKLKTKEKWATSKVGHQEKVKQKKKETKRKARGKETRKKGQAKENDHSLGDATHVVDRTSAEIAQNEQQPVER